MSYDSAGNLTADKDGYGYQYDYENRIVKITKDSNNIAEFACDALGRRIRKIDSDANETTHYYYNNNWQVLCEYDGSGTFKLWYAYGNYIDEVLLIGNGPAAVYAKFYVHDHLYSPAGLVAWNGTVVERYEYDAYGNPYILEPNFAADPDGKSDYGNPYLFTGRRVDLLDNGSLTLQYSRHRYYDYYTGRWTTHDPAGRDNLSGQENLFAIFKAYTDGLNAFEYAKSNPIVGCDPQGLWTTEAVWEGTFDADLVNPISGASVTRHMDYKVTKKHGCTGPSLCELTAFDEGAKIVNKNFWWGPDFWCWPVPGPPGMAWCTSHKLEVTESGVSPPCPPGECGSQRKATVKIAWKWTHGFYWMGSPVSVSVDELASRTEILETNCCVWW